MNKFDDQLKFEGKLSNENNFLAKKTVKQIAMSGNPSEFFKQDAVALNRRSEITNQNCWSILKKQGFQQL